MLPATGKETESSSLLPNQICQRFSIDEILLATKSFDDSLVIGRGGFGMVYKGPIKIGSSTNVAIKRLHSMSNQGAAEFRAEVEMLSQLRHCNLVSLIGYCNDKQEMILVYEYMPHGTLEDHLHKVGTPLSWLQRLRICVGAARGLDYLHTGTGTQHGIIHRDVKTSNILLDENFAAKISDFGLAKIGPTNQTRTHVSTGVKGTFGYMDPCYFYTGKLTRKSDVYAFGVVLLELLCGRPAVDETLDEEQWGLVTWAQDRIRKGKLNQIVDSRLRGQISAKCLKEFASIAGRCVHNHPKQRPTMAEVVVKLKFVLSLQESMNSSVNEHTLIERVRSYLTSNFNNLMKSDAVKSNDGRNDVTRLTDDASNSDQSLKIFTYAELVSATVNFKHQLFNGRNFDEIPYKGSVDERTYSPTEFGAGMAIFVRKKHPQRKVQLDLDYLKEFNHPNLVKLLGYCSHDKEFFYVYEYVPNGSLDRLLFNEPGTSSLPWVLRIKIAIGAAQGLSFLHRSKKQATYSQFKTSVILLDADFTAKLSDFELQKSWLAEDTYYFNIDAFYAAPEWLSFQIARLDSVDKSDDFNSSFLCVENEVYAFGVVLLEILTGKKVYDLTRPQGKENLVKWASPWLKDKKNVEKLLDPQLKHEYHLEGGFQLALLISKCLEPIPEKRPSMEEVLQVLYQCYQDETK